MARSFTRLWVALVLVLPWCCAQASAAQSVPATTDEAHQPVPSHTQQKHRGKASIYSRKLAHKPMADGTPLDLDSNSAASRHLPLGSRAKVTNLHNGKTAEVEIRDRGPFVKGRIIDLTPKTAKELGFKSKGLQRVEVTPIPAPSATPGQDAKPAAAADAGAGHP